MKISAIKYYLSSFFDLLTQTEFRKIPSIIFKRPLLLKISKLKFYVWNLMDIWTLKEVIINKQYEIPEIKLIKREKEL